MEDIRVGDVVVRQVYGAGIPAGREGTVLEVEPATEEREAHAIVNFGGAHVREPLPVRKLVFVRRPEGA